MSDISNSTAIRNDTVPLVTIGITCYNASDTIRRSVESALAQRWPRKEIIVVDDASRDESRIVLEDLQLTHRDLRIIRHEVNRGYPGALNTLIREASGDLIAIFDDDDVSVPDRLGEQWRRLSAYEAQHGCDLVFCYSNRNVVKSGASSPHHVACAIGRRAPEPHGAAVADYLFGHTIDPRYVWGMFGSCTLLARRDSFIAVGAFDETFRRCAEWDFAVRAAFMSGHFIAVDKPLITQFKTKGADKAGSVPLKYALQLREKYKSYLSEHGVYWASRAIAHSRFHGAKGARLKSHLFLAAAYVASPRLLFRKLRQRAATVPLQQT
ncbi:MAG TPA: glycosyltransferase family 2 protein [Methyloceanibacter sp.]